MRRPEAPCPSRSGSWRRRETELTAPRSPPGRVQVLGGQRLEGHVAIGGAKNSALCVLAAALLSEGEVVLNRVPTALRDVGQLGAVLESVGARVTVAGDRVAVDPSALTATEPDRRAVRALRASILVLGPLLARCGAASVALPGGCNIGARPIDLHVRGLEALGATVAVEDGFVRARVAGRLRGARIYLDFPSVGATETIMMAAALAEGETVIENVAQEPEIKDLADFLNAMGARVRGAGSHCIAIEGVARLRGTEFTVIPDRIEAGTFLAAAAITRSELTVGPVVPQHLSSMVSKLESVGCEFALEAPQRLKILPSPRLVATDITTLPYPGFPTDMQPQFMALMACAEGASAFRETVFENRLQHAFELGKMGADIKCMGSAATVLGKPRVNGRLSGLYGADVTATDLRAGAALCLAGLAAEGVTTVRAIEQLDRGYEGFDAKLRSLGAQVLRRKESDAM